MSERCALHAAAFLFFPHPCRRRLPHGCTDLQNRTGCHPARGLIRSLSPEGAQRGNGTIEIMRVPVPLVPGQRVNLAALGFGEFGHGEYTKYKVSSDISPPPLSLIVLEYTR